MLFSCEKKVVADDTGQDEALMTEYSENLTIVKSENGRKEYHFTTPLLEGYTLARDPYREFRKGVHIVTYKDDSLSSVDATLTANYAIFYIDRNLWEAKGNVVVDTPDRILYTQQLFWNAKTKRIYSNVDTKIEQKGSRQVFFGEGIESDDALKDWRFRNMTGVMEVKVEPAPDSVATAERSKPALPRPVPAASASVPEQTPASDSPSDELLHDPAIIPGTIPKAPATHSPGWDPGAGTPGSGAVSHRLTPPENPSPKTKQ